MLLSRAGEAIGKGVIAGGTATVVISVLMMIQMAVGLMPAFDLIAVLAAVSGTPELRWVGWIEHALIGTVAWGILFVYLTPLLPSWNRVIQGLGFGVLAWLLMMITLMPMAGFGLFGLRAGVLVPLSALLLHLVYGLVLGAVYGGLMGGHRADLATPFDLPRF